MKTKNVFVFSCLMFFCTLFYLATEAVSTELRVSNVYSNYIFRIEGDKLIATNVARSGNLAPEEYFLSDLVITVRKSNFMQEKFKGFKLLQIQHKKEGQEFLRFYAVDPISFARISEKVKI